MVDTTVAGDPARLAEWFPGVAQATVEGETRTVTLAAGGSVTEEIVTLDPLQRRLQYRICGPLFRQHLSTLDVIDLGPSTLVVYGADAEPAVLALVVAAAAAAGLGRLRTLVEVS